MLEQLIPIKHVLAGFFLGLASFFTVHQQISLQPLSTAQPVKQTATPTPSVLVGSKKIKKDLVKTSPIIKPLGLGTNLSTTSDFLIATSTPVPPLSFIEINEKMKAALVNILCITKPGSPLTSITGTGITIDPRGVILTNAHIGQYFLLQDSINPSLINCTVRTGSPASDSYMAKILYLPPLWIQGNPFSISGKSLSGTGEHDFALLLISQRTDITQPFPTVFPFITPIIDENQTIGEEAAAGAYPAEFLNAQSVENALYSTIATTTITNLESFSGTAHDLISLKGNFLAQRGSSGGAIVDMNNNLLGIISTVNEASTTDARTINAVSIGHINRSLTAQAGSNLSSFLSGNIYAKSEQFNNLIAPKLTLILLNSLGFSIQSSSSE